MSSPFKAVSLLIVALFFVCSCTHTDKAETLQQHIIDLDRVSEIATEAKQFCQNRNLNTDFFILIDLGRHSGLKRFYIWDFATGNIAESYLVSHGCCNKPWRQDMSKQSAGVSNVDGSHCSSVGKYIIGERGPSSWGIRVKYLLHGLDPTNSNALKRAIVLHSWEEVPDNEVYPKGTPEGWGCPAISDNAMRAVDQRLKSANKRVLMWIVK